MYCIPWQNSEHLFNLKFASKDLERNAKKCEKSEKEEKVKLKKVIINDIIYHIHTRESCCLQQD